MNYSNFDTSYLSQSSSGLTNLDADQQQRLSVTLERYLSALEAGAPLDQDALCEQHPDLADRLRSYFRSLDDLHGLAAGFGGGRETGPSEKLSSDPDAAARRRIGDFRLLGEIGRGGMGVVYEAQQISLDRRVALKVLPFAAVLDAKQIARFKTEAQAAAQLQHPNIVPVYAIGVERGIHYYAMQFIDGQPLDKVIAEMRGESADPPNARTVADSAHPSVRGKSQSAALVDTALEQFDQVTRERPKSRRGIGCHSVAAVLRLGIQAAEALHTAHEYGVIHRDIKPANLLLDGNGKLWVTDFGLARIAADRALTRTGDVVGTLHYMSPEQATGQSALVDHRTDIYALGVTLYELLTTRSPFGNRSSSLAAHPFFAPPVALRKLRPEISADLETVILKAMAKDRDDRYATAQAFADDLRCVLDGKPTIARPPTPREKLARWARGNRRIVTVSAVAAAVMVVASVVGLALLTREKQRAEHNLSIAQENFRQARAAVDRLGAHFAERLADVPGARQARQELLQETLQYYLRFATNEQVRNNPALQDDLATTYGKMATLADEIGSTDEALAAHRAARQILEQACREQPENSLASQRLAQCFNNLAMTLQRVGRREEARQLLVDAIRRLEPLEMAARGCGGPVASNLDRHQVTADLALAHGNLAKLDSESQQSKSAEAAYRVAIRLLLSLVAEAPNDHEFRHRLAGQYNNLASMLANERASEAAQLYAEALEQQTRLVEAQPASLSFQRAKALTLNNLGSLQTRQSQWTDAVTNYEAAIACQRELLRREPDHDGYRYDLAVSLNNAGLIWMRQSDWAAAEKAFQQSRQLHEQLLAHRADDVAWSSGLGGVFNNLASVWESTGKMEMAATAFQQAIAYQKQAFTQAPTVVQYRQFLSKHLFNFGRVARQLGRVDEALRAAESRCQLWPDSPQRLFAVAEEFALAGQQLETSGRQADAGTANQRALELIGQALDAGYKPSPQAANHDAFVLLKKDPRFQQLFER